GAEGGGCEWQRARRRRAGAGTGRGGDPAPGRPAWSGGRHAGRVVDTFRGAAAASLDGEPMVGTAPTDATYLLVEYAGAWGRKALAESKLPEEIRTRLGDLAGVRVLLIRRHGGLSGPGVRIFTVQVTSEACTVETGLLREVTDLLQLDLDSLAGGTHLGLTPYEHDLHLVCTNGRRDLC